MFFNTLTIQFAKSSEQQHGLLPLQRLANARPHDSREDFHARHFRRIWSIVNTAFSLPASEAFASLSYWRLASGIEVDFVVNDMQVAVEAKASSKVSADHLRGLRALVQDYPRVKQRIIVCLEPKSRRTEDGVLVLPATEFCQRLQAGELF